MSTYHQPTNVPALQAAIAKARAHGAPEEPDFDGQEYQERYLQEFGRAGLGRLSRSMRIEEIRCASAGAAIWIADHHAAKVRHGVLRELENNYGFGSRPPMPGINHGRQCGFARELPKTFGERLEAVCAGLEHHGFDHRCTARAALNAIARRFMDALDTADERTAGLGKGRAKARVAEYQYAVTDYMQQLDDWFTALRADFFDGGISSYWHAANRVRGAATTLQVSNIPALAQNMGSLSFHEVS